ncbi:MFS transporter [Nonomuraea pusilla]|uniref:MFS transporter n=1 Tax=Nonomuraea pusilla TaxID=46177 RepID=UPI00333280B3
MVCSLAPSVGRLIAGRVLQGVGAAALSPASLALLAAAYPAPRERVRAIGLWAGFSGIGLAAGPLAGGILVESFGWPAIFLVNVPIGAVLLLAGLRTLPASLAMVIVSPYAGRFAARYARHVAADRGRHPVGRPAGGRPRLRRQGTTRQIGAVLGAVVHTRESGGASFESGLNSAFLAAGAVTLACAVFTGLRLTAAGTPRDVRDEQRGGRAVSEPPLTTSPGRPTS